MLIPLVSNDSHLPLCSNKQCDVLNLAFWCNSELFCYASEEVLLALFKSLSHDLSEQSSYPGIS